MRNLIFGLSLFVATLSFASQGEDLLPPSLIVTFDINYTWVDLTKTNVHHKLTKLQAELEPTAAERVKAFETYPDFDRVVKLGPGLFEVFFKSVAATDLAMERATREAAATLTTAKFEAHVLRTMPERVDPTFGTGPVNLESRRVAQLIVSCMVKYEVRRDFEKMNSTMAKKDWKALQVQSDERAQVLLAPYKDHPDVKKIVKFGLGQYTLTFKSVAAAEREMNSLSKTCADKLDESTFDFHFEINQISASELDDEES